MMNTSFENASSFICSDMDPPFHLRQQAVRDGIYIMLARSWNCGGWWPETTGSSITRDRGRTKDRLRTTHRSAQGASGSGVITGLLGRRFRADGDHRLLKPELHSR